MMPLRCGAVHLLVLVLLVIPYCIGVPLAILQADEHILIVFHDLTQHFEAVVEPGLLSDLSSLNLCKHFVVVVVAHTLLYWSSFTCRLPRAPGGDRSRE